MFKALASIFKKRTNQEVGRYYIYSCLSVQDLYFFERTSLKYLYYTSDYIKTATFCRTINTTDDGLTLVLI